MKQRILAMMILTVVAVGCAKDGKKFLGKWKSESQAPGGSAVTARYSLYDLTIRADGKYDFEHVEGTLMELGTANRETKSGAWEVVKSNLVLRRSDGKGALLICELKGDQLVDRTRGLVFLREK